MVARGWGWARRCAVGSGHAGAGDRAGQVGNGRVAAEEIERTERVATGAFAGIACEVSCEVSLQQEGPGIARTRIAGLTFEGVVYTSIQVGQERDLRLGCPCCCTVLHSSWHCWHCPCYYNPHRAMRNPLNPLLSRSGRHWSLMVAPFLPARRYAPLQILEEVMATITPLLPARLPRAPDNSLRGLPTFPCLRGSLADEVEAPVQPEMGLAVGRRCPCPSRLWLDGQAVEKEATRTQRRPGRCAACSQGMSR